MDEVGGTSCDEWSNLGYILEAGSTGLTDRLAIRCEGKEFRMAPAICGLSHYMNGDAIYLPGRAWGQTCSLAVM